MKEWTLNEIEPYCYASTNYSISSGLREKKSKIKHQSIFEQIKLHELATIRSYIDLSWSWLQQSLFTWLLEFLSTLSSFAVMSIPTTVLLHRRVWLLRLIANHETLFQSRYKLNKRNSSNSTSSPKWFITHVTCDIVEY